MESTESPATATAPPTPRVAITLDKLTEDDAKALLATSVWPEAAAGLMGGPAIAMREDGKLLGAAGLMIPVPWLGEAWVILTPEAMTDPEPLFERAENIVREFIAHYRPHRTQCHVIPDDTRTAAWVKGMGFEYEGRARQLGPLAEDVDVYSLLPITVPQADATPAHEEGQ